MNKKEIVKLSIIKDIENDKLKPFDKIDSESLLIKKFDTSKPVVREALKELKGSNYIFSKAGSGNYVKPNIFIKQNVSKNKKIFLKGSFNLPKHLFVSNYIKHEYYNERLWKGFLIIEKVELNNISYSTVFLFDKNNTIPLESIGGKLFERIFEEKRKNIIENINIFTESKNNEFDKMFLKTENNVSVQTKISYDRNFDTVMIEIKRTTKFPSIKFYTK